MRAGGLAAALCLVLALRVFLAFDAYRVKLIEVPVGAVDGAVHVDTAGAELARLTPPFAVIARIRHDSSTSQSFEVHIDGRVVCEPSGRPGVSRRIDCASSGTWESSSRHQIAIKGPRSPWTLEYLEFATHHGATRGHDLVIAPANSTRYGQLPGAWIVLTWIGLTGLLLTRPTPMGQRLEAAYNTGAALVVVFLALVLISRTVSPYAVLLSRTGFLRAVGLLLAPRIWTAVQWLLPRPVQTTTSPTPDSSGRWVVVVSGALGFGLGALAFPDWQVAVETAQVVAGLVTYPPDSPFYVYHTKLWTVLHQLCAVLLLADVSEHTLSMIISGLLGMVSFQALSLIVYALSSDALLAVGSAVTVFFTGIAEAGVMYPISLMGTTHTYGALGLSTIVLVAGLLGLGWRRTGGFLLGLAPAVHPSLGFWFVLVVALAAVWNGQKLREKDRSALAYFFAGCGVTVVSLVVQLALVQDVSPIDSGLTGRYLTAFISFWDGHRGRVDFRSLGVAMNVGALALAAIWLYAFDGDLPRPARFLLRIVAVSGVLSVALAFVSWMRPQQVPAELIVLMPGRFLNFNALIFPALLFGLIGRYKTIWAGWLTLLFTGGLLLTERSRLWTSIQADGSFLRRIVPEGAVDTLAVLALASIALLTCVQLCARRDLGGLLAKVPRIAVVGLMIWIGAQTWQLPPRLIPTLRDRSNDPVLSATARGGGLLLTGGALHLVQLRTRRAVLLDGGGLDGLPYSLEAGPELERILRDVYAIDFFNPPEEARGAGVIPNQANRMVWERYSPAKWQEIRQTYRVTQVLTYADWNLALPVVIQDEEHVLYQIPP